MSLRTWSGILVLCLLLPTVLLAQSGRRDRRLPNIVVGNNPGEAAVFAGEEEDRPSHRIIYTDLDENLRPEEALKARLSKARLDKLTRDAQLDEKFQSDIRDLARRLMQDEKLLESLKDKFDRNEINKLLGEVRRGEGIGNDPKLAQMLRELQNSNHLSRSQTEILQGWRDKLRQQGVDDTPPDRQPKATEPNSTEPRPQPPPTKMTLPTTSPNSSDSNTWKLDPKTEDWLKRHLDRWANDLEKWVSNSESDRWRNLLNDFSRRYESNRQAAPNLFRQVGGVSKYLPRLSNIVPRPRLNALPNLPRLPLPSRLGMPSIGGAGSGGVAALTHGGKLLLLLAVLGLLAFLLFRKGGWIEQLRQSGGDEWRLGPWPVRPEQVRTRGELIRAFEYLALLVLGKKARTQHHLELAQQIGEVPCLDPDRRRDAVQTLASLYEYARYRPEAEVMSDEEIRRARRELCYLAGVAAA